MNTQRILYLDLVKLFAIYLVIFGHLPSLDEHGRKTIHLIYSFHMPLFMMLSGYFVSERVGKISLLRQLLEKGKQLLLPAVTCTVIVCVYLLSRNGRVDLHTEIVGTLWFLKTLFACHVINWLIKRLKINEWMLFIISTLIFFMIPQAQSLQLNWLWPMFWGGQFLRKYDVMDKITGSKLIAILFPVLFVLGYIVQIKLDVPNYVPININSLQNTLTAILLRYGVALSGSVSVILLFLYFEKNFHDSSIFQSISIYGKYTLGVYVLQTLLVERLFRDTLHWYADDDFLLDVVVTPLLSFGFLTLCLWLIHVLSKNKTLDLLFFGGQYYKR